MFEHSLIDLETKTQPRRRWLTLPLAVGVHLVALTGFAFASYWSVGKVADPDLNMAAFVVMLPPPEIQQGGGRPPTPTPTVHPQQPSEATPLHQPDPLTPATPRDTPAETPREEPGPILTDDPAVPPGPPWCDRVAVPAAALRPGHVPPAWVLFSLFLRFQRKRSRSSEPLAKPREAFAD
jgi:hypothetical protein